uniref:Putative secreted protein n=1 Tax=Ixodes ricinus TaxID=34613 RepID=A0A6B0UVQ1_IXORI
MNIHLKWSLHYLLLIYAIYPELWDGQLTIFGAGLILSFFPLQCPGTYEESEAGLQVFLLPLHGGLGLLPTFLGGVWPVHAGDAWGAGDVVITWCFVCGFRREVLLATFHFDAVFRLYWFLGIRGPLGNFLLIRPDGVWSHFSQLHFSVPRICSL